MEIKYKIEWTTAYYLLKILLWAAIAAGYRSINFWSNGDLLFAIEYSLDDNGEGVNDNDLDNGEGVNDLDDDDDGVFILYFFPIPSVFPPILVELCKVKILRLLYWWMEVPTFSQF